MEAVRDNTLTQDRLRELLHYDPDTGIFTWVATRGPVNAGDVAGTIDSYGYVAIGIDGRKYHAHRLAFLYMTGSVPPVMADHIDMDTTNNAWTNLRPATRSQNGANRHVYANSQTRLKGVYKSGEKFKALITVDGKLKYLGTRETAEAAHALYAAAANDAFGEYARTEESA